MTHIKLILLNETCRKLVYIKENHLDEKVNNSS